MPLSLTFRLVRGKEKRKEGKQTRERKLELKIKKKKRKEIGFSLSFFSMIGGKKIVDKVNDHFTNYFALIWFNEDNNVL